MNTYTMPSKRNMSIAIHLAVWCLLLGLPLFFTGRDTQTLTTIGYLRSIIVPTSFMLVFYINYFLLIRRYLFSRHGWMFLLNNILLIALTMFSVHLLMQLLPPPDMPHPHPHREKEWQEIVGFFSVNALLYALMAGLSVAIRMTDRWYETETMRRELERTTAEAELRNLKSQLNPHFLFNTLNNIYSLIAISPERAQESVHDLSRLLRYVLYDSDRPFVSLSGEIDFIRRYIRLMHIRLSRHVTLETDIVDPTFDISIAPLLFISLIENAFKHGVSSNQPSYIYIGIHCKPDSVVCLLKNTHFPKDAAQDKSGSGIGIANLRKRLDLIYPGRYLYTQTIEGDIYRVSLVIHTN